jgi:MFS family permease
MLGDTTVYTVLPLHLEAAGITLAAAGILMGANRIIRLFSNSIYGYLFDIGPKKGLFIFSLFTGSVSTLIFAVFRGFWPLFFSRILWGISWSGISIGGASILLSIVDRNKRGKWMGIHHLWFIAGNIFGSMLGGFLSDTIGYRGAMAVNGVISLFVTIFVLLLMPRLDKPTISGQYSLKPRDIITVIKNRELYFAAGILGISRLIFSGFVASLISIITKNKISPFFIFIGVSTLTGIISSSKSLISMISAPVAGLLSDIFKDRWTSIIVSFALGAAGLILTSMPSPILTITGILLCAIPGSSIMVLTKSIAGDISDHKNSGRAIGFVSTAGDFGSAVGPPIAFFMLTLVGLDLILQISSLILIAVIISIIIIKHKSASRNI